MCTKLSVRPVVDYKKHLLICLKKKNSGTVIQSGIVMVVRDVKLLLSLLLCELYNRQLFNDVIKISIPEIFPKNIKWSIIDRWATHPLLVKTLAERIKDELEQFPDDVRQSVIILFSVHSLPLKVSVVR